MKRTVIFGGSFDPLHIGHENIIRNLADRFDEVIVVPTYVSPFKQAEKAASPELRLAMLRSANFRTTLSYLIMKSVIADAVIR